MSAAVMIRETKVEDVPTFFAQQQDLLDHWVGGADRADRAAFDHRWQKIFANEGITKQTILHGGEIAGYVALFERDGVPEVTYWIGSTFRRKGLATEGLRQLLDLVARRPLYARAAAENLGSLRVLEKCGFRELRRETVFSQVRERNLLEVVFELPTSEPGT